METLQFEDLDTLLRSRRSCRAFRPEPVEDSVIEQLLTTAQQTPSWCNTQPWGLTVTSAAETDRLREVLRATPPGGSDVPFPERYEGVYLERRREVGWQLYEAVGVARGDREASTRQALKNYEFFDAPHTVIVDSPKALGAYGAIDCGLFLQSFVLAAEALGLGTCIQAATARYSDLLRDRYDIGDDRLILCGIAFGHADLDHPSATFMSRRASIDQVARIV